VIRSIRPLVGILTSCNVRQYCNYNAKANLFKTGCLIETQIFELRKFPNFETALSVSSSNAVF
jgi:hypothetical protein